MKSIYYFFKVLKSKGFVQNENYCVLLCAVTSDKWRQVHFLIATKIIYDGFS